MGTGNDSSSSWTAYVPHWVYTFLAVLITFFVLWVAYLVTFRDYSITFWPPKLEPPHFVPKPTPGPDVNASACEGYRYIRGTTVLPGHAPWTLAWDMEARTVFATHPGGGRVTGSIESMCTSNRFAVKAIHTDQICICFGDIKGVKVTGQCGCSGQGGLVEVNAALEK
jgi:hypothetical protein